MHGQRQWLVTLLLVIQIIMANTIVLAGPGAWHPEQYPWNM